MSISFPKGGCFLSRTIFRFLNAAVLLLFLIAVPALAAEASGTEIGFETVGISNPQRLFDDSTSTYTSIPADGAVTLTHGDGITALYIKFDRIPLPWTLTDPATGKQVVCGQNAFLHEYVDTSALFGTSPGSLVLTFPQGAVIADIYGFSGDTLPHWVQQWQPPCQQADLLLISSHSDDEQLFFAGVLPYYTIERNLSVQVAYVVQHFEAYGAPDHRRPHEQLDGLWAVGVRNYPVMSDFPDLYSESKDRSTAFSSAQAVYESAGVTYSDFVGYMVDCIRRFQPLVIVSHDLNGEYGHGTHVYAAAALTDALVLAADESQYTESAAAYGAWTVEKTYLHLYPENQITMDWDTPLESLGGKTPFQITQEGFSFHKSQHWTWFYKWIYGTADAPITQASQVRGYSPCRYGLYDSKVGPDTAGGDFFENVETYAERIARTEAEAEAARLQAEAEAAAKAKADAEAAARALEEAAAKAKEEAEARARAEEQARADAAAERQAHIHRVLLSAGIAAAVLCFSVILFILIRRRKTVHR